MPRQITRLDGVSKASQLKDVLLDQIIQRGIRPGEKICTEADLIRDYGVSVATVRKVLDELSRQGITERRVGKGTFLKTVPGQPNRRAQAVLMLSMMTQLNAARDAYYGRIIAAMEEKFSEADQRFLMMSGSWGRYPTEELNDLRNANPAALIFPYSFPSQKAFIAQLTTLDVPLILLGSPFPGAQAVQVYFDDYRGGVLAAEHMLKLGYRHFGILAAPDGSKAGEDRVEGFLHTIRRSPDAVMEAYVRAPDYDRLSGYELVSELLDTANHHLDAIYCAGDLLAHGAIQHLKKRGIAVPEHIGVMGYGNFVGPWGAPNKLTTINMDLEVMGTRIAETILQLPPNHRGPLGEQHVVIPVNLVEGETTVPVEPKL